VALAGYFTVGFLPPFNFCYQLWRTSYLVKDVFASCSATWRNIRYRKWDAVCKLAVSGVNTVSAVNSLYRSYHTNKYWYEMFTKFQTIYNSEQFAQVWTMLLKLRVGDPTAFDAFPELKERIEDIKIKLERGDDSAFDDILGVIEHIFGYSFNYQSGAHSAAQRNCPKVDAAVAALPDLERVSDPSLIPECPEHAATILSSNFDRTRFCEEVDKASNARQLKYLNGLFRKLNLLLHPDKLSVADKEKYGDGLCAQKANRAKDILADEIHRKIYCK
jgi:hypothetical protein